jgi:hypothetical protein
MANNAQNHLGLQPDFRLISQCHQILAGELRNIPNIPQYHAANAILDQLRLLNGRLKGIDKRLGRIDIRLGEIDGRLDTMVTAMRIG